jgi:hypothetical protein
MLRYIRRTLHNVLSCGLFSGDERSAPAWPYLKQKTLTKWMLNPCTHLIHTLPRAFGLFLAVVDVDVRWAGEPDVVLHLTKLGGASLGLSDVQLAGVVRLVFSPITEDPPFLRRVAISLLKTPYVDFSVRALGGPDLMTLPAVSSWLRSVVTSLAQRAIVFPREVAVAWAPVWPAQEDSLASAAPPPPLGVLIVRVLSADIEPRRSTFLGRFKAPSPRLALLLPDAVEGDAGVVQAGLTEARDKTLKPKWERQFVFVVAQRDQRLRVLVSHKRMDLLGADMPLGLAEVPLEQVIADAGFGTSSGPGNDCAGIATNSTWDMRTYSDTAAGTSMSNNNTSNVVLSPFQHASSAPPAMTTTTSPTHANHNDEAETPPRIPLDSNTLSTAGSVRVARNSLGNDETDDGFASACSSPRGSIVSSASSGHAVWASPAGSLAISSRERSPSLVRTRTVDWPAANGMQTPPRGQLTRNSQQSLERSLATTATATSIDQPCVAPRRGLGLIVQNDTEGTPIGAIRSKYSATVPHWTPPKHSQPPPMVPAALPRPPAHSMSEPVLRRLEAAAAAVAAQHTTGIGGRDLTSREKERERPDRQGWMSPEGVWVQVPPSGAVTMAGLVTNAMQTLPRDVDRTPPFAGTEEQRGWLSSLQSFVLGGVREEEESDEEAQAVSSAAMVGKVRLHFQYLPVAPPAAVAATVAVKAVRGAGDSEGSMHKKNGVASDSRDHSTALSHQPTPRQSFDNAAASGRHQRPGSAPGRAQSARTLEAAPSSGSSPAISTSQSELGLAASPTANALSSDAPPRMPSSSSSNRLQSGILAVHVSYTKMDYGDALNNPVLALSVGPAPPLSSGAAAAAAAAEAFSAPRRRTLTMECQSGGRPGLLHWNRVFHLVVWDAAASRARLELGEASSTLKLSSYGSQLYALDACHDFESAVTVDATATIPLKDVLARGVVRGTWRLREARGGRNALGRDADRLDVGRVAILMAWYPLSSATS